MRPLRLLFVLATFVVIGAGGALVIDQLSGGPSGGYLVRVVFDNSSFVIPGEDVKVAGVKVGSVKDVQLTADNKAALVLRIDDPQFRPFRTDAHCEIGLESLLGEQFVQCTPTQPGAPGRSVAPALAAIASGPYRGQHLLPVQNTTAPVGVDLLADIQRLPQQQRLRLIITGLGAGLAGNGQELNAALLRADPALQQTDDAIAVLARQDRLLANLTDESDRVLAPLAAQRAHIGGFIQHVGTVALASAQEGKAIEQNFQDFPPFLRQLGPASVRLNRLAQQMTPALQALQAQAPAVDASVRGLGPLAKTSIPALQTLGRLAQRGEVVFPRAQRVALQLDRLGVPLLPLATDIAALSSSFDKAGGIEDVMRFIYYYAGSVNGEDALGHYIRSLVEISNLQRTSSQTPGSGSTFRTTTLGAARDAAALSGLTTAAAAGGAAHAQAGLAGSISQSSLDGARSLINYLLAP